MIRVTITVVASDNSGSVTSKIYSVASSDPSNTTGDGNSNGDWNVLGPLTLDLRAERASQSVGRTYTITIQSKDAFGNVAYSTVTATDLQPITACSSAGPGAVREKALPVPAHFRRAERLAED